MSQKNGRKMPKMPSQRGLLEGPAAYREHADEVDQSKGGTQDPIATRHELSPFRGRRARGALGSSQCTPFIRAELTLPWVIGR
jgi:hypothetical protein